MEPQLNGKRSPNEGARRSPNRPNQPRKENSATSSASVMTLPSPGCQALLRQIDLLERHEGGAEFTDRYVERSPISWEIDNKPLPERFKMPSVPIYQASSDPFDHLDAYNVQMSLFTTNSRVKCRYFPATLGEFPRK
ncbi:hypothetical protein ACOSQ3_018462 [Xanthoceras sorbifolium]